MKKSICAYCAYWCAYDFGQKLGQCRRHAPAPMYSMLGDKPQPIWWPETLPGFWCGDFSERNESIAFITADRLMPNFQKIAQSPQNFPKKIRKKILKKEQKENIT